MLDAAERHKNLFRDGPPKNTLINSFNQLDALKKPLVLFERKHEKHM